MKCSLDISNFLEEISSLSHSAVFLYFFALIAEEGFLISCSSLELCIQMLISFLFSFAFRFNNTSFKKELRKKDQEEVTSKTDKIKWLEFVLFYANKLENLGETDSNTVQYNTIKYFWSKLCWRNKAKNYSLEKVINKFRWFHRRVKRQKRNLWK